MTAESWSYVDDVGTEVLVDTVEDISTATIVKLNVRKPSGTEVEWAGAIYQNHYIRYIIQADDLDEPGEYAIQADVTTPSGHWLGSTAVLSVHAEFD